MGERSVSLPLINKIEENKMAAFLIATFLFQKNKNTKGKRRILFLL